MKLSKLHLKGSRFVDAEGRNVMLRGVNLGGDCKYPYPDGGTYHPTDFSNHREVSFVGRPFPLDEAVSHFKRLQHWGFNFLRLLTTWEAIEHAGPGLHDQDYLDYFREICRLAGEHGLYVFIDFHQDVFSRMTGGDGAPGWVFDTMGLDFSRFHDADAALVMQNAYDYNDPRPRQEDRYPQMSWLRNYSYPANGIAWTLFFGGRDFAPSFLVDGINIQDYLQEHFFSCQRAVAKRVVDLDNVVGFDTINEPSAGFIGLGMQEQRGINRPNELAMPGLSWTPLNALYACAGNSVEVPVLDVSFLRGAVVEVNKHIANKKAVRVWAKGCTDPFMRDGAWLLDEHKHAMALDPNYFTHVNGQKIEYDRDYLMPFVRRVAETVRAVNPDWLIFFEKDGNTTFSDPSIPEGLPERSVYAPHWYDMVTLMLKRFTPALSYDALRRRPMFGIKGIYDMYVSQLTRVQRTSGYRRNRVPLLVGEWGIPFDMNNGAAYRAFAKGDRSDKPWRSHIKVLDLTYDVLDHLLLSSTQWNYTASNRNDARIGDGWNQEDLSIFSPDQQDNPEDPNSGGRALPGFVRPIARRVQGRPTHMSFDLESGDFVLEYEADLDIDAATEIFVPHLQYPDGFDVRVDTATVQRDEERQIVSVRARRSGAMTVSIKRQVFMPKSKKGTR